jgi:3-oxoacyl-[acyl-carrier-protein] synthase-3
MSIGIKAIGSYIPKKGVNNLDQAVLFKKNRDFIIDKIGAEFLPRKDNFQDTSDLACLALENLFLKNNDIKKNEIDAIVLVTQNPDNEGLPHTAAIIQNKFNFEKNIAAFDVSLGCSGYVSGLHILRGFLESSKLKNGILITCDPYSKIIDEKDVNTSMLFGDAATATLLTTNPVWEIGSVIYGTDGSGAEYLKKENGKLHMNGRQIFNFASKDVIIHIQKLLNKENIEINEIDLFCFHQGSKAIIDNIKKKLGLDSNKCILDIDHTGNTVSSTIPLILEKNFYETSINKAIICGFGVGLSISTSIIKKIKK